jgi:hypothetical protein
LIHLNGTLYDQEAILNELEQWILLRAGFENLKRRRKAQDHWKIECLVGRCNAKVHFLRRALLDAH